MQQCTFRNEIIFTAGTHPVTAEDTQLYMSGQITGTLYQSGQITGPLYQSGQVTGPLYPSGQVAHSVFCQPRRNKR